MRFFKFLLLGKGQSIWDHKSHTGGIYKNQTGDIACDSYHRYEEDIQLLTELNVIMTLKYVNSLYISISICYESTEG